MLNDLISSEGANYFSGEALPPGSRLATALSRKWSRSQKIQTPVAEVIEFII